MRNFLDFERIRALKLYLTTLQNQLFSVRRFSSVIFSMCGKFYLRAIRKKYAADPEKGFPKKIGFEAVWTQGSISTVRELKKLIISKIKINYYRFPKWEWWSFFYIMRNFQYLNTSIWHNMTLEFFSQSMIPDFKDFGHKDVLRAWENFDTVTDLVISDNAWLKRCIRFFRRN